MVITAAPIVLAGDVARVDDIFSGGELHVEQFHDGFCHATLVLQPTGFAPPDEIPWEAPGGGMSFVRVHGCIRPMQPQTAIHAPCLDVVGGHIFILPLVPLFHLIGSGGTIFF